MRTVDNRLMVLAISTLAAEKALRDTMPPPEHADYQRQKNALDSLAVIATELEKAARAGDLRSPGGAEPSAFHAGHAIGLHVVIELARQVPLTGDAKADTNITNSIARAREVQRWLEPLAHTGAFAR